MLKYKINNNIRVFFFYLLLESCVEGLFWPCRKHRLHVETCFVKCHTSKKGRPKKVVLLEGVADSPAAGKLQRAMNTIKKEA